MRTACTVLSLFCCFLAIDYVKGQGVIPLATPLPRAATSAPKVDTETDELTATESLSVSITPPPTPTPSFSFVTSRTHSVDVSVSATVLVSESATITLDPGQCHLETSVIPLQLAGLPFAELRGAPDSLYDRTLRYYTMTSTEFAQEGFIINQLIHNAVYEPKTAPNPRSMVRILVKSQLYFGALVAEDALAFSRLSAPFVGEGGLVSNGSLPSVMLQDGSTVADVSGSRNDFPSKEGHGLNDFLESNKLDLRAERTHKRLSVRIGENPSYRIAEDEWIVFLFPPNNTVPEGCATEPVVLHVTAFRPSFIFYITNGICFAVIIAGILATCSQSSIPTSHHAGMIAILSSFHFAQEDGTPLSLALNPSQWAFDQTKYRYVRGAMLGNMLMVLLVFFGQVVAVYVLTKVRKYSRDEAERTALFPRLTGAFVLHLGPSIMFVCGRNFGSTTVSAFLMTSVVLVAYLFVAVVVARCNVSSQFPFMAKFIPRELPSYHPLLPNIRTLPKVQNTILRTIVPNLTTDRKGYWKATDTDNSFVIRHGFVFENYTEKARSWMIFEFVDFFLTSILAVFDNYTLFLAVYQFGTTCLLKITMLIMTIVMKPILSSYSFTLLLVQYASQVVALLAVTLGSTRRQLSLVATNIQDVACLFAAVVLLCDVGIAITRSLLIFYQSFTRNKSFDVTDETRDRQLPLEDDFSRAKPGVMTYNQRALRRRELLGLPPLAESANPDQEFSNTFELEEVLADPPGQAAPLNSPISATAVPNRLDEDWNEKPNFSDELLPEYDSDGLPVDRDHPLFKARKKRLRQKDDAKEKDFCRLSEEDERLLDQLNKVDARSMTMRMISQKDEIERTRADRFNAQVRWNELAKRAASGANEEKAELSREMSDLEAYLAGASTPKKNADAIGPPVQSTRDLLAHLGIKVLSAPVRSRATNWNEISAKAKSQHQTKSLTEDDFLAL